MPRPRKELALAKELESLSDLNREELCAKWRQLYQAEPPTRLSQSLMIGAIAYKLQENAHGGLSEATRKFLRKTAGGIKTSAPTRQLKPGTVLLREWQGVTHEVTILDKGVQYRGRQHRSLTGVARLISGIHRSGPEFFGIRRRGKI